MAPTDRGEADTPLFLHFIDMSHKGMNQMMIRTVTLMVSRCQFLYTLSNITLCMMTLIWSIYELILVQTTTFLPIHDMVLDPTN